MNPHSRRKSPRGTRQAAKGLDGLLLGAVGCVLLSAVLFAGALHDRQRVRDARATETFEPPASSLYPVASADASPTPRERSSRVAQDLLGTLPDGAVVDDFRIFWPGPVYSVRGHAPPGPASLAALDEWKKLFDTLKTTDRTPYQVWFKRLEKTPEGNVLAFELLLVPEGLLPPS